MTAPFGFFALLRKALRELDRPSECIVVFDGELGWTERTREFDCYKSNRREVDFSPVAWLDHIQSGLTDVGVSWQETNTCEADDLIATVANSAEGRDIAIMSTDKDFFQLLCPTVSQLNTSRSSERRFITEIEVRERFNIEPKQWCDYVALVGDQSDGIPGIRGIGKKRATTLLSGGAHLEDLEDRAYLIGSHGQHLKDVLNDALKWRSLVELKTTADVAVPINGRPTAELPLAAKLLEHLKIW